MDEPFQKMFFCQDSLSLAWTSWRSSFGAGLVVAILPEVCVFRNMGFSQAVLPIVSAQFLLHVFCYNYVHDQ